MSVKAPLDTKGFNINLQFQNNLPLGHGHGLYSKVDFTEFNPEDALRHGRRTTSLEKKHLWEASADPFCGMKINLVDQDKLLRHSTEQLEAADLKIVHSQKQSMNALGNKGARGVADDQTPYWLRNTTYLENNPFNKYSNSNEEEAFEVHRELRKRKVAEDVFDKDVVARSFSKCEEVIKSDNGPKKRRKVVSVFPIVPDTLLGSAATVLVRFDEDLSAQFASNENRQTMILAAREPTSKDSTHKAGVFHATVTVPLANDELSTGRTHRWFRDFRMEMQDVNLEDSYLLVLDSTEKVAKYLPVRSRTEMKRLDFQQSVPRDVLVKVSEN